MQPVGLLFLLVAGATPTSSRQPADTTSGVQRDQSEMAAVEQLAREYRIVVYRTFRQRRVEHNRRRRAWDRVLALWRAAGSPPDQRPKLIGWLRSAKRSSSPGVVGLLPADPEFQPVVRLAQRTDLGKRAPGDAQVRLMKVSRRTTEKPLAPSGASMVTQRQRSTVRIELPGGPTMPQSVASEPTVAATPGLLERRAADKLPDGVARRTTIRRRPVALPSVTQQRLPKAVRSSVSASRRIIVSPTPLGRRGGGARLALAPGPTVSEGAPPDRATPVRLAARRVVRSAAITPNDRADLTAPPRGRRPGTFARGTDGWPSGIMPPPARQSPPARVVASPTVVQRRQAAGLSSTGQRQPPAQVPRVDRWGPILPERKEGQVRLAWRTEGRLRAGRVARRESRPLSLPKMELPISSLPPIAVAGQPGERSGRGRARVNVEELAARVAGHNLALQGLEAELDEQQDWNAQRLAPLVERLRRLVTRSGDLTLFCELISQRDRATVGELESPRNLIAQSGARIFEARTRATTADFPGTDTQQRTELEQLDRLSRALAEMLSGE